MSKIGKVPVSVPKGVKVDLKDNLITIIGPKGTLARQVRGEIDIKLDGDLIVVTRSTDQRLHRSLHGLTRVLISNMITGVTDGYSKTLLMVGIGYRAEMKGKILELSLGYSHPILLRAPDGIDLKVIPKENKIIISGTDKQLVGQVAAKIRSFRPPEPYKGKGIKYIDEMIRRKAGKAAGK